MKYCLAILLSINMLLLKAQNEENPVHIAHYEINLSVLDFAGHRIEGHTRLFVVPQVTGLTNLQLDLDGLMVDSVMANSVLVSNFTQSGSHLIIPLTPVPQGDTVLVQVYYQGTPVHDPGGFGGFYFSGNVAYNMGVGMTVVPHSYGRAWFPCIDSFTDKATYQFNIRTAIDKKAVCGGLLTDSTLLADNTIVWHWQLPDPIPTYLASVAVSNYQLYRDTLHGLERIIPIEIYATPSGISAVPTTFATLKAIAHHYEWCFGPYQWQKIGYVVVPFNGGAMEHATNISYPQFAVNGNLNYESLFAHELSHSWFGNLVTCATAQDMWINEGFARYNELLAAEALYATDNPATDGYRVAARALMRDVLLHAHTTDGDYYAVNQVPIDITYGATTYDKGGTVAHALRYYLGDSLFFQGFRALMQQYKFQNIGSVELFSFLSQETGVNLNDFYEAYVNQPGFLHFSIDTIRRIGSSSQYKVAVRQKLLHALQLGNNQLIDITFFDAAGQHYTEERCTVSGESSQLTLTLPFEPLFGVVDYNERLCDAVIDYNFNLTGTGIKNATDAAFTVQVTQLGGDSAWLRVERHLVAPDTLPAPHPDIYLLSDAHYWSVEYIAPPAFDAVLQFRYNAMNANSLDYSLLHQNYPVENLVLLYRRKASDAWLIAPYTRIGSQYAGLLKPVHLAAGEYALAMGNPLAAAIPETAPASDIRYYPNPTTNRLTIELPETHCYTQMTLYDSAGKVCLKKGIRSANFTLSLEKLPAGVYMATFTATDGRRANVKITIVN